MIHRALLEVVRMIKQRGIRLLISTNGGMRNAEWWHQLASLLDQDDRVLFCIDGLADTNHLYRIGVVYDRVIENLKAFNQAGGKSIWTFIVFRHNQHQVEPAEQLSKELGCHGFAYKPTSRFVDKQHKLLLQFPVLDKNKKISHYLEPPNNNKKYVSKSIESYQRNVEQFGSYTQYLRDVPIRCDALHKQYFSVTAQGYVFPCQWLYDRMYGIDVENHPSRDELMNMIQTTGGLEKICLYHTEIDQILDGEFFTAVQNSWNSTHRLERCANQCGLVSDVLTSYDQIELNINKKSPDSVARSA